MCKLTMEAGMADGGKCQIANFKNTTRVLTIGDVPPDYRCHQYSNLTYPLGIGPLGCEYSTLLYSLVCPAFNHLITTFAHAHYGYSLYFLSKQKILTKHL